MSSRWQIAILDALEALDRRESPHGLYGIRQAHASGRRLPTLAHLLCAPGRTDIVRPSGFRAAQRPPDAADLQFRTAAGEWVGLQVLDYATTKVRHYGSRYRVDDHHAKEAREPDWNLESLVPKLSKRTRHLGAAGVLLVAHYQQEKALRSLLGRSVSQDFLNRYQLDHADRGWDDRFGRDFRTAIHLWSSPTGLGA